MYLLCGDGNAFRKVCVGYDHCLMTTTPPSVNREAKFFLSLNYGWSHCLVQHNNEDVRCQGISLQNPSMYFKEVRFFIGCYDSSFRSLVKEANCINQFSRNVRICSILPLRTLSNAFLKSMNTRTAFKLWLFTPSISRLSANMCAIVECPGRNPFWLGRRCLSIFDLILLSASVWSINNIG